MATTEEVVQRYIELRDKKDEIMREAKEKAAAIDAKLNMIEGKLLEVFETLGVTSVSTTDGTAFISERTSATVADWDAAFAFIEKNEFWHMLEKRVNKKAVDEYREEHNDLPPGVNYRVMRTVNVRRAS